MSSLVLFYWNGLDAHKQQPAVIWSTLRGGYLGRQGLDPAAAHVLFSSADFRLRGNAEVSHVLSSCGLP